MEHKKVNFLHSVRLKMLLAMAFFAFRNGRICVRTVYFFYEGGNRLSHTWIYA